MYEPLEEESGASDAASRAYNTGPPPAYMEAPQGAHEQQGAYDPQGAYSGGQQPYQQPFKQDPQQPQFLQYATPYGQQPYPQPYQPQTNLNVIQNQQQAVAGGGVILVQQQQPVSTYLCLSCLTFWFCNCLFGGIAMIFSCMSMSARDGNNVESARTYGSVACWLSVVGIIITTFLIMLFLGLYVLPQS